MSAVATRRRPEALIRRLPDADGRLVTYLPNRELCEAVGIASSTLACWAKQGLVRFTDRLSGSRNYAVVDAAKLRKMTVREARELGIQRVPDEYLAHQREWYRETQDGTRTRAEAHGEVWDDYDVKFLVENYEAGRSIEVIAKALGRTYAAVADRIEHLRQTGDIDKVVRDEEWLARTIPLLTLDELVALTGS